jgi:hypothetical protein
MTTSKSSLKTKITILICGMLRVKMKTKSNKQKLKARSPLIDYLSHTDPAVFT